MTDREQREHRTATIAKLVVCLGAGLAIALVSGIWMLFPAPLLLVASVWASSTSRSPHRPNHPAFLDVFELLARKKGFTFCYPTLLAFVVMASGVAWLGVKTREIFPESKFMLVLLLGVAVPLVLYLTLFIEVLQFPKEDKSDEGRGGKPDT